MKHSDGHSIKQRFSVQVSKLALLVSAGGLVLGLGCSSNPTRNDSAADSSAESAQADLNQGQSSQSRPRGKNQPQNGSIEGSTSATSDGPSARDRSDSDSRVKSALRSGDQAQVESELGRRLLQNPEDVVALNALAMWNYKMKRFGAARLLVLRAIEKSQPSASLYANYGLILAAEGEPLIALEQYKRALRIDDEHPGASAALGASYVKGGDYVRAEPLLKTASLSKQKTVEVALNYAIALQGLGKKRDAEKVFEEAVRVYGNKDARLLVNYAGLLIEQLDRPKEGLQLVYRVKLVETERRDILNRASELEKKALSSQTVN